MSCVNCNKEIDIEFGPRQHVLLNSDGDFACSSACARSWKAKLLEAADLPYNREDIIPREYFNPLDP